MIVWTEKDDRGIEALKLLTGAGHGLLVGEGTYVLKFEVIDFYKANHFLMDIFHCEPELEKITGIKVTAVGHELFPAEKRDKLRNWLMEGEKLIDD